MLFYLILAATWLFAQLVRRRMKATYARYSAVPNRAGLQGAAVARHLLDANGLQRVRLEVAPGTLTDHYDPRTHAIRLSLENAHGASVAAMAVSAHEASHALQDAADYAPLELRPPCFRWSRRDRASESRSRSWARPSTAGHNPPGHARLCGIDPLPLHHPSCGVRCQQSGPGRAQEARHHARRTGGDRGEDDPQGSRDDLRRRRRLGRRLPAARRHRPPSGVRSRSSGEGARGESDHATVVSVCALVSRRRNARNSRVI